MSFRNADRRDRKKIFRKRWLSTRTGRKKEDFAAGDPTGAVGRDTAARYDAMQMRVQVQILTPGVKHGQEADGGAQQPWVCCGFQQSSGGGVKEHVVNRFGVLQRQPADRLGQREHHVEIGDRQKFRLPLRKPAGASRGLALGAMAIPTRVI